MNHLVIVDGHAIAHRAYHSIPPLSHNGQPVNAIYGFYSMLLSAIDTLKPDHLIVCLDSPGPTFRQSEFIAYRAKRKPADRDLITQLPQLPITLNTAHIPNLAMGGYEADDLIATIVKNNRDKVDDITIITGDKDLMQLVDSKVQLFMPIQGLSVTKIIKPDDVREKLGVSPAQVIDLKALMGDMSDCYPGVPGIGPKVATDLLKQFGTLDNIYKNLDKIKPTIVEKLSIHKESAYLSQKLATLIDNIPLSYDFDAADFNNDKIMGLSALFKQYNFKSLYSRLNKKPDEPKLSLF
jgi:DNA polymerase I